MGRGPTKEEIARGTRKALQRIARNTGAVFSGGQGVTLPNAWSITTRLIRASNGEAALLFRATDWNGRAGGEHIDYASALRDIGFSVQA